MTMPPSAAILCVLPLWFTAQQLSSRPSERPGDELLCVWMRVLCPWAELAFGVFLCRGLGLPIF